MILLATDPTVFDQFMSTVFWPCLSILVPVVAGVIALQIKQKFGIQVDQATVEKALQNGLQKAQAEVATMNMGSADVQKSIVNKTMEYAIDHAPAALKSVGVDIATAEGQKLLGDKIAARLAPAVLVAASSKADMSVATAATIANPNVSTAPGGDMIPPGPATPIAQTAADAAKPTGP